MERGLGKLVDMHTPALSSESKNDWKYSDAANVLYSQIKLILGVRSAMESLEKTLLSILDDIAKLYSLKEKPVWL